MNNVTRISIPAGVALLAGLVATFTGGALHDFALIGLIAGALAMIILVMRLAVRVDPDVVLGGPGYHATLPSWMLVLHGLVTLIYLFGTILVAISAMRQIGILDAEAPLWFIESLPAVMAFFVALMGATVAWKVTEHGFVSTWYSRVHGGALLLAGLLVILAGLQRLLPGDPWVAHNTWLIYLLVVALGTSTQVLFQTQLPTLVDFTNGVAKAFRGKRGDQATPPVVYAGLLSLLIGAVLIWLTARFELLRGFGGFGDERSVYVIVLIPVLLAIFFAISAFGVWREARRGLFAAKISTRLRNDLLVYSGCAIAGLTFGITLVRLLVGGSVELFGIALTDNNAKDLVALTVISTTAPIGIYLHKHHRDVRNIEARLPDLLNDLAESRRAGLTMFAALKAATRADYGALSHEVNKMSAQVGWGVPFNDALLQFGDRVKTPLVQRSVRLVVESSRTGGNIAAVLKAAARDIREMKGIEEDRRITMSTYLIVVYVVFFVFLVVIASLEAQFVPQLLEANQKIADSNLDTGFGGAVDAGDLEFVYFNAAIVQAIGNGIVGGVLIEGRITSGFRHVAIMTGASWVLFRVFLAF